MPELTPTPALAPALPRAPILAYLTGISTPTRVRQLAGRFLRIIAALLALAGLSLAYFTGMAISTELADRSTPLAGLLRELLEFDEPELAFMLIVTIAMLTIAALLWVLAGPVKRGNRFSCFAAFIALLPVIAASILPATLGFVFSLFGIVAATNRHGEWWTALLLPIAAALVTIPLLIKDIMAYLIWIARNPIIEKPPVKFLP